MVFGNDSDKRYPIGGSLNNNTNNEMNGITLDTNGEPDLSRQYLKKSLEKIHGDKDSAEISAREWDRHQRHSFAHWQDHDLIAAESEVMDGDGSNKRNVGLNRMSSHELTTDDDEGINVPSCTSDLDKDHEVIADHDILTGGSNDINEYNEYYTAPILQTSTTDETSGGTVNDNISQAIEKQLEGEHQQHMKDENDTSYNGNVTANEPVVSLILYSTIIN